MKKILLVFFFIITIVGCSCKKEDLIVANIENKGVATENDSSSYLYGEYGLLSYELKDTSEYDQLITNKESFMIFIYSDTCYGCKLLAPALADYVINNQVSVYSLSNDKISDKHALYEAGVNTTPFLVLIEEGKIKLVELIKLTNDASKNKTWVKDWINKHVEWSEN